MTHRFSSRRRGVLQLGLATGAALALPALVRANALSRPAITVARPLTVLNHAAAVDAALRMDAFRAEGLQATVNNFRSWSEVTQLTVGGTGVFGLGASTVIRAVVGQNAPIRQIGMVSTLLPYNFWSRPGSGIEKIADLKGKRIQTVRPGETLDLVWNELLADAGLAMSDVTRIEGFDGFGALASNTVDAANMNDSLFGRARQQGFRKLVDYNEWRRAKGFRNGAANLGWATSQATLDQHPDTVRAFLRALVKATVRMRQDKAFALEVMTGAPYRMDPKTAEESWELHRSHWMVRMDPSRGDFDFDIEKAARAMNVPLAQMPRDRLIAPEPVRAVLNELGVSFA
jgi:ABC-type nitrate/sulfonate/bicarbonate transport system substrate-binding protein